MENIRDFESQKRAILDQMEYYFSEFNLIKDEYLKNNQDVDGWVTLKLIVTFNKMRQLGATPELVIESLKLSNQHIIEVDEYRKCVRRNPRMPVQTDVDEIKRSLKRKCVIVCYFPKTEATEALSAIFDAYPYEIQHIERGIRRYEIQDFERKKVGITYADMVVFKSDKAQSYLMQCAESIEAQYDVELCFDYSLIGDCVNYFYDKRVKLYYSSQLPPVDGDRVWHWLSGAKPGTQMTKNCPKWLRNKFSELAAQGDTSDRGGDNIFCHPGRDKRGDGMYRIPMARRRESMVQSGRESSGVLMSGNTSRDDMSGGRVSMREELGMYSRREDSMRGRSDDNWIPRSEVYQRSDLRRRDNGSNRRPHRGLIKYSDYLRPYSSHKEDKYWMSKRENKFNGESYSHSSGGYTQNQSNNFSTQSEVSYKPSYVVPPRFGNAMSRRRGQEGLGRGGRSIVARGGSHVGGDKGEYRVRVCSIDEEAEGVNSTTERKNFSAQTDLDENGNEKLPLQIGSNEKPPQKINADGNEKSPEGVNAATAEKTGLAQVPNSATTNDATNATRNVIDATSNAITNSISKVDEVKKDEVKPIMGRLEQILRSMKDMKIAEPALDSCLKTSIPGFSGQILCCGELLRDLTRVKPKKHGLGEGDMPQCVINQSAVREKNNNSKAFSYQSGDTVRVNGGGVDKRKTVVHFRLDEDVTDGVHVRRHQQPSMIYRNIRDESRSQPQQGSYQRPTGRARGAYIADFVAPRYVSGEGRSSDVVAHGYYVALEADEDDLYGGIGSSSQGEGEYEATEILNMGYDEIEPNPDREMYLKYPCFYVNGIPFPAHAMENMHLSDTQGSYAY